MDKEKMEFLKMPAVRVPLAEIGKLLIELPEESRDRINRQLGDLITQIRSQVDPGSADGLSVIWNTLGAYKDELQGIVDKRRKRIRGQTVR
jgi:hypothetical protein